LLKRAIFEHIKLSACIFLVLNNEQLTFMSSDMARSNDASVIQPATHPLGQLSLASFQGG